MMVGHPRRIVSGLEAVFVMLLMLGLRPGEALGLRWENIDVDGGIVRIVESLKLENSTLLIGPTR
jgi:integrase